MRKHCPVVLALVFACGGSQKHAAPSLGYSPQPTPTQMMVETANLVDNARATTWSTGYVETEGAPSQKQALAASRQNLDVSTVVSLVRERLSNVAVLAVADTIERLRGKATRPWARDLLAVTAKLATAASSDWRPVAESGLRVLGRVLIAEAVVRTRKPNVSVAEREVLVDWAYWYLAQTELLKDNVAPPACGGRPGICADISGDQQNGSQRRIEQELDIDRILDGIRLVGRLRAAHADSQLSATLILEQLLSAKELGSFDLIEKSADELIPKLDELQRLNKQLAAFELARDAMNRANDTEAPKLAQPLLDTLNANTTLVFEGQVLKVHQVLARLGGDKGALALDNILAVLGQMVGGGKVSRPSFIPELLAKFDVGKDAADVARDIAELKAFIHSHRTLDGLQVSDATELVGILKRLVDRFKKLATVAVVSPGLVPAVRSLEAKAKGVVVLLDRLATLAELAVGDTLEKVHKAVRALRKVAEPRLSTPVLDVVAPILDKLADGRRLTAADVFAAVSDVGPADLVRALGADFDLEKVCENADSWQCWSLRLAMSVHGSLKFDGNLVTVDSNAMIATLAKMGTDSRKTKSGSVHILASVGTGTLYTDEQWRPLIAEQIGASVVLFGSRKATLSLGGFGSGILYRFVLDDKVSDGAMLGGTLLLRLYDLVEVHADFAGVYVPGDSVMGTSAAWHPGFIIGAQVPLGDYLERLRD
jgi:hypothetical protein